MVMFHVNYIQGKVIIPCFTLKRVKHLTMAILSATIQKNFLLRHDRKLSLVAHTSGHGYLILDQTLVVRTQNTKKMESKLSNSLLSVKYN